MSLTPTALGRGFETSGLEGRPCDWPSAITARGRAARLTLEGTPPPPRTQGPSRAFSGQASTPAIHFLSTPPRDAEHARLPCTDSGPYWAQPHPRGLLELPGTLVSAVPGRVHRSSRGRARLAKALLCSECSTPAATGRGAPGGPVAGSGIWVHRGGRPPARPGVGLHWPEGRLPL